MPTCEHCGEEFPKGGAYTTHVRYCNAKPDSDESPQNDTEEDPGTHESAGGGTVERIGAGDSSTSTETRSNPPEVDSAKGVETADPTDNHPANEDQMPVSEHAEAVQKPSRKWVAAIVLSLLLLVIWRLLSRNDD